MSASLADAAVVKVEAQAGQRGGQPDRHRASASRADAAAAEVEAQAAQLITWKIKTASGLWLVPPYRDVRMAGRP